MPSLRNQPWIKANDIALATNPGPRPTNEDCCDYLISPEGDALLVALSDGMGGRACGEVASSLAVQVLIEVFRQNGFGKPKEYLAFGIQRAHETIVNQARENSSASGMGATIVAAVIQPTQVVTANVGDSRGFQFADGFVRRLTQDHLYVCENNGVPENKAKRHPEGHILSQALGHDRHVEPDVHVYDLQAGDTVVLCSDGVSEFIDEPQMAQILGYRSLPRIADSLISHALQAGTRDNCTVAAVRVPTSRR